VARGAPDQVERTVAESLNFAGVRVDRHHGRLIKENAALARGEARVRSPDIQRYVNCHERQF
jgi:hypothetical protein